MMDGAVLSGSQWRFESVDLRAGMGIALWRKERANGDNLPPDQAPALFFCPPHFRPEPVVNIAMALSACRGTFAPGLYVDEFGGPEASFRTPAEVGEFLRRAYVGGAGGDGGDGGDVLPVPPSPEGGGEPNPELPLEFGSGVVDHLQRRIEAFQLASRNLPLGDSESFSWEEGALGEGRSPFGHSPPYADENVLVTAAELLLSEMMRRMPVPADDTAWLRWHDDLRELANSSCTFGVAELLNPSHIVDAMMGRLVRTGLPWLEGMDEEDRYALCWLLLFGPEESPLDRWPDLYYWLRQWRYRLQELPLIWSEASRASALDDPFDLLMRLPVPHVLQSSLPNDLGENAALFHLLHVFLAEPQAFGTNSRLAICLAVFASACIASSRRAYQPSPLWGFRHWRGPGGKERARKASEQAYAWLIENLAQRVYSQRYEESLAKAKRIRYFVGGMSNEEK